MKTLGYPFIWIQEHENDGHAIVGRPANDKSSNYSD